MAPPALSMSTVWTVLSTVAGVPSPLTSKLRPLNVTLLTDSAPSAVNVEIYRIWFSYPGKDSRNVRLLFESEALAGSELMRTIDPKAPCL